MKKIAFLLFLVFTVVSCSNSSEDTNAIDCNLMSSSSNTPSFNEFRISFYNSDGIVSTTQDYTLDNENRIVSVEQVIVNDTEMRQTTFNYNDCGLLESIDQSLTNREYTLEYDGIGRIIEYKVTQAGGFKYTFEYISQNEVFIKEWRIYNEQTNDFGTVNTEFVYTLDSNGLVISKGLAPDSTTNSIRTDYQYDGAGNVLQEEFITPDETFLTNYTYGNASNSYYYIFEKMYGRKNLNIMWELPLLQHVDLRFAKSPMLFSTLVKNGSFPEERSVVIDEAKDGFAKTYQVFYDGTLEYQFAFNF